MPGATLLHAPPTTLSVKVAVLPTHTVALAGDNAAGVVSTVTDFVAEQPKPVVYNIFTVPAATPVTIPDVPTVAVPGAALLHTPPDVRSPRLAVPPTHMVTAPGGVIADGFAFTVKIAVAVHTPLSVYVIVAVPGALPVTSPEPAATEAVAGALLVHTPPPPSASNEVDPTQALSVPVIGPGAATTVTFTVAALLPHELDMV